MEWKNLIIKEATSSQQRLLKNPCNNTVAAQTESFLQFLFFWFSQQKQGGREKTREKATIISQCENSIWMKKSAPFERNTQRNDFNSYFLFQMVIVRAGKSLPLLLNAPSLWKFVLAAVGPPRVMSVAWKSWNSTRNSCSNILVLPMYNFQREIL